MKDKFLGTIIESFTMQDVNRVMLLDRDCSADLKVGDLVRVEFSSGTSTVVKVLDAFLEEGSKFGVKAEKIASIAVNNVGFPKDYGAVLDGKVFISN